MIHSHSITKLLANSFINCREILNSLEKAYSVFPFLLVTPKKSEFQFFLLLVFKIYLISNEKLFTNRVCNKMNYYQRLICIVLIGSVFHFYYGENYNMGLQTNLFGRFQI